MHIVMSEKSIKFWHSEKILKSQSVNEQLRVRSMCYPFKETIWSLYVSTNS